MDSETTTTVADQQSPTRAPTTTVEWNFIKSKCPWHPLARYPIGIDLDWRFVLSKICADSGVFPNEGLDPLNPEAVVAMKSAISELSHSLAHPVGPFLSPISDPQSTDDQLRQEWTSAIYHYLAPGSCVNTHSFPPVVRNLVRAGVPPDLREHVWLILSGGLTMLRTRRADYAHLAYLSDTSSFAQLIDLDLSRTFQDEPEWRKRGCEAATRRILGAYSIRNPSLGYCQGLSYVAATLTFHLSEECAFAVLCSMLEDGLIPPDYYTSLQGAVIDQQVLEALVESEIPGLVRVFDEEWGHKKVSRKRTAIDRPGSDRTLGVASPNFCEFLVTTLSWQMCLFSATLALPVTARAWDHLFAFGSSAGLKLALGILHRVGERIMRKQENLLVELTSADFGAVGWRYQKNAESTFDCSSDESSSDEDGVASESPPSADPRAILHSVIATLTQEDISVLCDGYPNVTESRIGQLRESFRREEEGGRHHCSLQIAGAGELVIDEDYFAPAAPERRRRSRRGVLYKQVEAFLGK